MTDGPASHSATTAAPQSFAALRHRGARHYLIGAMLAMMADNVEHVISYWILYQKFHSPALGGFAVLSHWLPFLLFSVYSGALADRLDPRRLIQIAMVMFMSVSVGWGVLAWTGTLAIWNSAMLLTVHGLAGVVWGPAGQMLVHDIVGRRQLQSAIRMMATFRTLGILFGPALGGVLLVGCGPALGILLNVPIYLPLTLWLWKAPYGPRFRQQATETATRALRGLDDIRATLREVAANRAILTMILLAGGASLLVGNAYQAQMPQFAHDLGHGGGGAPYSVLLAATAAGAVIAGLVLESRSLLQPHPRTALILATTWCVVIAGFAVTSVYPLAVALLFVAGFLDLSYNSMAQTLVQLNAPAAMRGRIIGVYNMIGLGLRAFSGVTVGFGGSVIGIHWSLALSAAVLLVVTSSLLSFFLRPAAVAGK